MGALRCLTLRRFVAGTSNKVLQPLLIDTVAGTACHSMHRLPKKPHSHDGPLNISDIPLETDYGRPPVYCLYAWHWQPRHLAEAVAHTTRATPTDVQLSCTTVQCSRMNDLVYAQFNARLHLIISSKMLRSNLSTRVLNQLIKINNPMTVRGLRAWMGSSFLRALSPSKLTGPPQNLHSMPKSLKTALSITVRSPVCSLQNCMQ